MSGMIIKNARQQVAKHHTSDAINDPVNKTNDIYTLLVNNRTIFSIKYTPNTADPKIDRSIWVFRLLIFEVAYFIKKYTAIAGMQIKQLKNDSICSVLHVPSRIV